MEQKSTEAPKLFSMKIFRLNKNNERENCVKDVCITPVLASSATANVNNTDNATSEPELNVQMINKSRIVDSKESTCTDLNTGSVNDTEGHEFAHDSSRGQHYKNDSDGDHHDENYSDGDHPYEENSEADGASTGSDIITSDSDYKDDEDKDDDGDEFTRFARQVLVCTIHRCQICDADFSENCDLQSHITLHHDKLTPACTVCKQVFSSDALLQEHTKFKLVHKNKKKLRCCQCGETHSSAMGLKEHLRKHSSAPYSCEKCEVRLKSTTDLNKHVEQHKNKKRYRCAYCGHPFLHKHELLVHRKKHQNKLFECPFCDKVLPRARELKTHVTTYHNDQLPFRCELCLLHFMRKSQLTKHMDTHNE